MELISTNFDIVVTPCAGVLFLDSGSNVLLDQSCIGIQHLLSSSDMLLIVSCVIMFLGASSINLHLLSIIETLIGVSVVFIMFLEESCIDLQLDV